MKLNIIILLFLGHLPYAFCQNGLVESHPQLAYWKLGSKSEVVIVLHGGPAVHHLYLRPEFDRLSESATIIYYDQRGCGKSERAATYTWQDHVRDLHRLINTLAPKKKVFLAGSSWGSLLAILYSYTYPKSIKGLILTGTVRWGGLQKSYVRESDFEYFKPHKQPMNEKRVVKRTDYDGLLKIDTIDISKMVEGESGIQLSEAMASLISAPLADSLSRIDLPILIFNGARSLRFDWVEEYMKLFSKAELRTFEAAGHDPWLSDPELFALDCNNFIIRNR